MKPIYQAFLCSSLLVAVAGKAQQPVFKLHRDSVAAVPVYKPVRLTRFDTFKKVPPVATRSTMPLRLPVVPAGEARYNAQYNAYRQQQLSGVRDHLVPNTYVPPPKEKPNILLPKKTRHVPKAVF